MDYLFALCFALLMSGLVLVLIVATWRSIDSRHIVPTALALFLALAVTEFFLNYIPSANPGESLQIVLHSMFFPIKAFLGHASIDDINPDSLLAGSYFALVLLAIKWGLLIAAITLTIFSLIKVLAKGTFDRMVLRFGRFDELFILYGHSDATLCMAHQLSQKSLDTARKKRLVALVDPDHYREMIDEPEKATTVKAYLAVLHNDTILKRALRHTRRIRVFLFDAVEGIAEEKWGDEANIFVFTERESIIQQLNVLKTSATVTAISINDLIARDLIRKAHPFDFSTSKMAKRLCLIGNYDDRMKAVFVRLVMNSPQNGSKPSFTFACPEIRRHLGAFHVEFPEIEHAIDLAFIDCSTESPELYDLLRTEKFDYLVISAFDKTAAESVYYDVKTSYSIRSQEPPRMTIVGMIEDTEIEDIIVDDCFDREARKLNEHYFGSIDEANVAWRSLSFFDRASSRAAAEFIPVLVNLKNAGATDDALARTEHLRWNAFHYVHGYRKMSASDSAERYRIAMKDADIDPGAFSQTDSDKKAIEDIRKSARVDVVDKKHICLVSWDDLEQVSQNYNQLTGCNRDFQEADRAIIDLMDDFSVSST